MSDEQPLKVAIIGYTPDEAPSAGHTQWMDLMKDLVGPEIEVETAYSTIDHEDFDSVVAQINDLQPELPDDFYECPDEDEGGEVTADE